MPSLHNLPTELLEHIFLFACIDGGRTGCALSLVSRRIRAASRRARFHSVALCCTPESPQVALFYALLARERVLVPGVPPRVRHLCLKPPQPPHRDPCSVSPIGSYVPPALPTHPTPPVPPLPTPAPTLGSDLAQLSLYARSIQEDARRRAREPKLAREQWQADVSALVQVLARDLHTLCIVGSREFPRHIALDLARAERSDSDGGGHEGGFPLLRELTVVGARPGFVLARAEGEGAGAAGEGVGVLFPSLERLHISPLPGEQWWHPNGNPDTLRLNEWVGREVAPRLTHFRLSGVEHSGYLTTIFSNLPFVFGEPLLVGDVNGLQRALTFHGFLVENEGKGQLLHRVILQSTGLPSEDALSPLLEGFVHGLARLWPNGRVDMAVLVPPKVLPTRRMCPPQMEVAHWRDRMRGGEGCWDVSDSVSPSARVLTNVTLTV